MASPTGRLALAASARSLIELSPTPFSAKCRRSKFLPVARTLRPPRMPSESTELASRIVQTLPHGVAGLFNPWRDVCLEDMTWNNPDAKLERLAQHLDCNPAFILVGEAPGYAGARHSGVAFTSERLLLEGSIPRISRPGRRLTSRGLPYSEQSATIVWKALYRLQLEERTILWNALQMHPHKPGDHRTNRTPTPAEIALGEPALHLLTGAFPNAKIVAVGRKAEGLLRDMGITPAAAVRHPANGGATAFASGLEALVTGSAA